MLAEIMAHFEAEIGPLIRPSEWGECPAAAVVPKGHKKEKARGD
jgi:hypothetical protein